MRSHRTRLSGHRMCLVLTGPVRREVNLTQGHQTQAIGRSLASDPAGVLVGNH